MGLTKGGKENQRPAVCGRYGRPMNHWAERGLAALVGAVVGVAGGTILGGSERASVLPPTACQRGLENSRALWAEALSDTVMCESRLHALETRRPAEEPPSDAPATGPAQLIPLEVIVEATPYSGWQLRVRVRNDSDKTVDAMRFRVELFDAFNQPVPTLRPIRSVPGNLLLAESSTPVRPGESRTLGPYELRDFPGTRKGMVTITSVHFLDNSTWSGSVTQTVDPRAPRAVPEPEPASRRRRSPDAVVKPVAP